ncbi:MAG TPA: phosphate acyltransferase PlsX [Firmicutes bacterium]|nr:phosphate acyltransferase PlsX [Bacillota bacterium]
MKIALDAMGGDFAPKEIVLGAIQASREFGAEVILVGIEAEIQAILDQQQAAGLKLEIYPATEVIAMDEHPANAVKRKKDSSLVVANRLVKEGKADAVISMGNTGAAMAASLFTLGRLSTIKRPAIASLMPTKKGISIILDAGANADCEPENLLEFAYMGSAYAEHILGKSNPQIGLLSIGEEETKGNKLTVEAHQLLKNSRLNFVGNIEGRDVHRGACDVIVCDGFVGNVVLKLSEGLASSLMSWVKEAINDNAFSMLGGLLIKKPLKKILTPMDPAEYGGMPLLGLNGISMIGHGSSKAKAVKNAIKAATKAVEQDIIGAIRQAITNS